jgi:hypothetical protein
MNNKNTRQATKFDSLWRSAELHSAVSQICNLRAVGYSKAFWLIQRPADCKSAKRQSATLRYEGGAPRQALLHRQPSGTAHRRAFTGLFTT